MGSQKCFTSTPFRMRFPKKFQEGEGGVKEEKEKTHTHTHFTFLLFKFILTLHSMNTVSFSSLVVTYRQSHLRTGSICRQDTAEWSKWTLSTRVLKRFAHGALQERWIKCKTLSLLYDHG